MPDPLSPAMPRLTPQEKNVLALLSSGLTTKEIAAELGLSPWTVTGHERTLREKFGARNRADLIAKAMEAGYRSGA